jgi:hypothetical protein
VPHDRLLAIPRAAPAGVADGDDLPDGGHQDVGREDHRDPETLMSEVDRLGLEPGRVGLDLEAEALADIDAAALQRA